MAKNKHLLWPSKNELGHIHTNYGHVSEKTYISSMFVLSHNG